MTPEIRRRIVERVLERFQARGVPFENDPQFLSHVEEWIDGAIDMKELRARYVHLLQSRNTGSSRRALPSQSSA